MDLSIDPALLLKAAEKEGGCILSVGGIREKAIPYEVMADRSGDDPHGPVHRIHGPGNHGRDH